MPKPLFFRLAEALRAVLEDSYTPPEFAKQPRAVLEEFDAKGYQEHEPIFVLRGRDELAPEAVKHWAAKGYLQRVDGDKLVQALDIAEAMEHFTGRRAPGPGPRDAEREAVRELLEATAAVREAWCDKAFGGPLYPLDPPGLWERWGAAARAAEAFVAQPQVEEEREGAHAAG